MPPGADVKKPLLLFYLDFIVYVLGEIPFEEYNDFMETEVKVEPEEEVYSVDVITEPDSFGMCLIFYASIDYLVYPNLQSFY